MNIRGFIFSIIFAGVFLFSGWQVLQLFWAQGELFGILFLDSNVYETANGQTASALALELVLLIVIGGAYAIATLIVEGDPFAVYYKWICNRLKTEQP